MAYMSFFSKAGNIFWQTGAKASASDLSVLQTIRRMSSSKLFVGGISYSTDEYGLREAFSKYGQVVEARVIVDRETGRSRGFGFVTFSSGEEASSAIQALDGQDLHGRRIRVNYASDRGGGFGGRGFGGNYGGPGGGYGNAGGFGGPPQNYGGNPAYSGNFGGGGGGSFGNQGNHESNFGGGYGGGNAYGVAGGAGGSDNFVQSGNTDGRVNHMFGSSDQSGATDQQIEGGFGSDDQFNGDLDGFDRGDDTDVAKKA